MRRELGSRPTNSPPTWRPFQIATRTVGIARRKPPATRMPMMRRLWTAVETNGTAVMSSALAVTRNGFGLKKQPTTSPPRKIATAARQGGGRDEPSAFRMSRGRLGALRSCATELQKPHVRSTLEPGHETEPKSVVALKQQGCKPHHDQRNDDEANHEQPWSVSDRRKRLSCRRRHPTMLLRRWLRGPRRYRRP